MAAITQNTDAAPFWPRPFWPPRNWWLALLAILVLAGALRFPGYDFSLPVIDVSDEAHHSLSGGYVIDTGSARPLGQDGYPPGIIRVYYFFLRFFQEPGAPTTSVIGMVRLLAITASLGTVAVLALLGYQALGEPFGLVGAAFWTITPFFVQRSRWATAEIFLVFFAALALWLALADALWRRERWSTYATYALMMAVLFKYTAAFIAPVLLLLPLWNGRAGRRDSFRNLALFAAFSAWLIFLTPAFATIDPDTPHQNWSKHNVFVGIPGPRTLLSILRTTLTAFDLRVMILGWLGVGFLLRRRQREAVFTIAVLSLVALIWLFGIGFWGDQAYHSYRFLIFMTTVLIFLAGVGYATWARMLHTWLVRRLPRVRPWASGLTLLLLFVVFLPQLLGSVHDLRRHMWFDPRNFVRDYMDLTAASGKYVISKGTSNLLNPNWGNYTGETVFDIASFEEPTDFPVEHWREQGVEYAILHYDVYDRLLEDDPYGYLRETTRLKGWEHQPNYRWVAMTVLRLYPIQQEATGQLGPIRLIGYELAEESARPGESIPFHLYWQAVAPTEADYQVFNHLLDGEGNLVAQADGPPLPDPLLRRGTSDWDDPEEILYSREYVLQIPDNLAPGEYSLVSGFYRRDTGQRLLAPTGEDSLWVTRITVE